MRKVLILLLVCSGVYAQDIQNIDGDTAKVAKSGYNRISIRGAKMYFRAITGTKKEVVSTNNSYSNPAWIPSLALTKITGLQDSLSNTVKKIAGKGLSTNDYTNEEKSKLSAKEDTLGKPASNGYILSSTTGGTRSWIAPPTGATWGAITGTLSSQSDLNSALNLRGTLAGTQTWTGANTFSQNIIISSTATGTSDRSITHYQNALVVAGGSSGTQIVSNFSGANGLLWVGNGFVSFATTGTERMKIFSTGNVSINSSTDNGAKFQVVGTSSFTGAITVTQYRLSAFNTSPTSATDTGTLGEIRVTATHIYVCTATNTWVRSTLTTW